MKHKLILLIATIGLNSYSVSAQVYNCSGVWTTKPCDNPILVINQSPDQVSSDPKDLESQKLKSEKISLIYQLRNFVRKFEDYKQYVPTEIKMAESFCEIEQTSLYDCQTRVNNVQQLLEQRENEKARVKIEQERLEVEKSQEGKAAIQVNIHNENNYIRSIRGIYDCHGVWQTKPCLNRPHNPLISEPKFTKENKGNSIRLRQHKQRRKVY